MARKSIVCLAVLVGAVCVLSSAGKAYAAKPEKLMRVTLDSEQAGFRIVSLCCLGADVVNMGGRAKDTKETPKRMTFDCLPGATIVIEQSPRDTQPGGIVRLLPEDNGKVVHLRFTERGWYKNGVLCSLGLSNAANDEIFAKRLGALKTARKGNKMAGLTVGLDADGAGLLPILQELKGTGAGLHLAALPEEKTLPRGVFQKLCRAIGEVEPRLLEIDSRGFVALKDRLSKVETLTLMVQGGDAVPDLSKLASLRHLMLVTEKKKGALDLMPLAKLRQLEALTIFVEGNCKSAGAIGELANLQFLTVISNTRYDPSILGHLPKLRYLATEFSPDVDLSFVEKTPDLQTLCILNVSKKHNLKPLEKLPHLRCLALSGGDEKTFEAKNFKNVKEFEKARPDVEVVPYLGICLGSLWLLLAAAAAAGAAWLVRRRRGGIRLACRP